uniref:Retroviral polymerase SH3-like domain-containing protein n=1 Tax=Oryza brachyantha TaxID=4533 RepID=J3KWT6_ORYBR
MAVYILNRSPAKALDGRTPYEAWHGRKPAVSHLRVFSCLAFTKQLGHIGKLDDRSTLGVFIGYAKGLKAYRILDPETPYKLPSSHRHPLHRGFNTGGTWHLTRGYVVSIFGGGDKNKCYSVGVINNGKMHIIVKFGSFIGMVVPVVLSILPYFYHGYALGALFIISVSIIFFVVNWDANPSEFVKWLFGAFGILSLVICHWIQLEDILHGVAERSQRIVTIIDIVPSCIMTVVSFVITFHTHPEHILILVSSAIGFILNLAEILLLINFATVGYLFPLAVNTNADVEPARQSDQPATQEPHPMLLRDLEIHYWMVISKLYRTRSATPFHPRRALADTLPLEENASKIPDIDDSIAVLILQVRNIYEIHEVRPMLNLNLHTRVLLVAAIPWMNMQIERDLYITMLLQASGMAEPHPMILRDLEIHHLMVISKLYCTRSATPFQPRRALAGIVPLEESVSMIPDTDDSIAVLILQVRNRYEIYEVRPMLNLNFQTRVLLVEAIPRMNMQIERDLYIPMLLQASGMAGGIVVELKLLLQQLQSHTPCYFEILKSTTGWSSASSIALDLQHRSTLEGLWQHKLYMLKELSGV